MKNRLPTAILALALLGASAAAEAQVTADALASRMQNMSRLLNESSGAKQVIASSNQAARQKRQQALDLYEQARKKVEAGAHDDASKLLDRSARLMFEAIQVSTPKSVLEDKKISDYEQRRESVMALKDAFNRIADESGDTESKKKVNRQLEQLIGKADGLLASSDNNGAQVEIDKAYHLLKVSIESKRAGQTLVRSLNFETKEDEYHYEIDRNETHRMLISLLVDEKQKSDYARKEILKFVEQATQLREQADAYAEEEAWEVAIELLEQSTRQLVRAIRTAGIYIPG